jgi:hypothetical protein
MVDLAFLGSLLAYWLEVDSFWAFSSASNASKNRAHDSLIDEAICFLWRLLVDFELARRLRDRALHASLDPIQCC